MKLMKDFNVRSVGGMIRVAANNLGGASNAALVQGRNAVTVDGNTGT